MIDIETLTRLKTMRLSGMAEYFENLADTTGVGKLTGPATSVTSAPASRAARATAKPIFPLDKLVMPRTGSMAS